MAKKMYISSGDEFFCDWLHQNCNSYRNNKYVNFGKKGISGEKRDEWTISNEWMCQGKDGGSMRFASIHGEVIVKSRIRHYSDILTGGHPHVNLVFLTFVNIWILVFLVKLSSRMYCRAAREYVLFSFTFGPWHYFGFISSLCCKETYPSKNRNGAVFAKSMVISFATNWK